MKNCHMFGIIHKKKGVKKHFFRPEKEHGFSPPGNAIVACLPPLQPSASHVPSCGTVSSNQPSHSGTPRACRRLFSSTLAIFVYAFIFSLVDELKQRIYAFLLTHRYNNAIIYCYIGRREKKPHAHHRHRPGPWRCCTWWRTALSSGAVCERYRPPRIRSHCLGATHHRKYLLRNGRQQCPRVAWVQPGLDGGTIDQVGCTGAQGKTLCPPPSAPATADARLSRQNASIWSSTSSSSRCTKPTSSPPTSSGRTRSR